MLRKTMLISALLATTLALTGCKSAKERAAEHLASAQKLMQNGDDARAIVELRNVFKLDKQNVQARIVYAKLLETRKDYRGAYAQYMRVIEQDPKDLPAIKAAARLAAQLSSWKEAASQVATGLELAPNDPELLIVKAAADYAAGITGHDDQAAAKAAAEAKTLLASHPDNLLLRRVQIDSQMRAQNYDAAEQQVDAAIKIDPQDKTLYGLKLNVLAARKDNAGIEAELKKMVDIFPDDAAMASTLVRWYVTHGKIDAAEAYLRQAAAKSGDETKAELDLVGFLSKFRGPKVALAELDKILAAAPAQPAADAGASSGGVTTTIRTFKALRASILFDQGQRDKGLAEMKAALEGAPDNDEARRIKVALAKMDVQLGDTVNARALVEQVLKQDKGQLDAVKMKAAWLIQGDSPDDAITLLRDALGAHPNDPEVMTLMAQAYQRTGNHALMGDMLSQAVDASNKAPAESIRYADYLIREKKYLPAESVLVDALRLDPRNVSILAPLGTLYVQMKDWPRATQVADRLDEIGGSEATRASEQLRPAILAGQQDVAAAVSYLEGIAQKGGSGALGADLSILRTYLAQGDIAKARDYAEKMLAKAPDNPQLQFIAATVQAAAGDRPAAEASYRALLKQDPKRLPVWLALIGQLNGANDPTAAKAALDEALKALPGAPDLLMVRAGFLERDGDIGGAIKIYDQLYQDNSGNLVLANNLASLLASYRSDDPQSVERAYTIARRLQGTTVPSFQDTYGWIVYLRGNPKQALDYLEPAAKALAKDPLAQFHLGETYRALNEPEKAKAQYAKVVALAKPDDTRPFVAAARRMLQGTPKPDAPKGG